MNRTGNIGASGGFTLIEVLAALAILGTALFVLLEAHYSALNLNLTMSEEVLLRQLVETTVAKAEVEVLTDTLTDSGDFGDRFPDYTWSFDAAQSGEDELNMLYEVNVTVDGPEESRNLTFFVYNTGLVQDQQSGTGDMFKGRTGGSRNSSSSSSSRSSSRTSNSSSTSRSTSRSGTSNSRTSGSSGSMFGGGSNRSSNSSRSSGSSMFGN